MNVHDDPKYQAGEAPSPPTDDPEVIISDDTRREERVPPGQSRTRKWPVLHYGYVPSVAIDSWTLTIDGLVDQPLRLSWEEFRSLPRVKVFSDFHCVTQWSRLGNLWEGVSVREIIKRVGGGYDSGWTTNVPLADFAAEDALLADTHDGEPIDADHGGPVRLMIPKLYAWKSAKWLKRLEFVADDAPGYWERLGYHDHGDPWTEERFR
ncbi:Uncharacterized oxidoreductase YuiH [Durusdinium trenchii]|uniref:Uncharacterized oxidoreductase YuiH n=1 Tax=Durusdinium trenchii TaxID=1381693 RepID=A0ABP0SG33_9DINO